MAAGEDLDQRIAQALAEAQEAWPGLAVEAASFRALVVERLPVEPGAEALAALKTSDLYLVGACLQGNPEALERLNRYCRPAIQSALAKMRLPQTTVDEVSNEVLGKLLVPEPGESQPKLAQYKGTGSLQSWIGVAAVRTALNFMRRHQHEAPLDDQALYDLASSVDQDLALIKHQYREEFRAAFVEALAALPVRDRNLLRSHFLDGLSSYDLAHRYRVHRATVSRWLEQIQDDLRRGIQKALRARLKLSQEEFDSIVAVVMSQFDISLSRVLRDGAHD